MIAEENFRVEEGRLRRRFFGGEDEDRNLRPVLSVVGAVLFRTDADLEVEGSVMGVRRDCSKSESSSYSSLSTPVEVACEVRSLDVMSRNGRECGLRSSEGCCG